MAMHACREEIGIVGAKLLFPHDHVQHAGIVLGIGGIGSEAFKYIHKTDDGYIHRAFLIGNYSAVTGACMLFRKSVWEELDGLNQNDTPNAYSDVDFCLRCQEKGYRILFTPFAQLYHHESASRGPENSEAFQTAMDYMRQRWANRIQRDPYYNPNLTLEREDFTLAFPPRNYSTK
jgi:GT2 family glycosyltransferase